MTELTRTARLTRLDSEDTGLQIGQWYWVTYKDWQSKKQRELMCVMHIGSNYALFQSPPQENQSSTIRIHFDNITAKCEFESNWRRVIEGFVEQHKQAAMKLLDEVKEICARLGVAPDMKTLADGGSGETAALVRVSSTIPVQEYKAELIKAQTETLPALFKQIKEEHKEQTRWMKAAILPLRARTENEDEIIKSLEQRVFNVELYAGLVEEVALIRDGAPAAMHERVRLLQRRHYMDEESLLSYRAGGLDFSHIESFDAWMAEPENSDRILPFPRCIVAFRVRRNKKEYDAEDYGGGIGAFIRINHMMQQDKRTFLYMRNGEKIYRLATEVKFKRHLFPDFDAQDIGSGAAIYAVKERSYEDDDGDKLDDAREWHVISEARLQGLREEEAADPERYKDRKRWHRTTSDSYEAVNNDNVYYDDVMEQVNEMSAEHNRLAIVLQGILDRSETFHPHPKWELWTGHGFNEAVELIYDSSRALAPADRPDFEAYRAKLNASLKAGCYVTGQQDAWEAHEAEKENKRREGLYAYRNSNELTRFTPDGNDGPGIVAKAERVGKAGVMFKWLRERQRTTWRHEDPISTSYTAPTTAKLLNVSAYVPGDFKQFFADPRTRAEYLKWAPLMLAAEDWHGIQSNRVPPPNEWRPKVGDKVRMKELWSFGNEPKVRPEGIVIEIEDHPHNKRKDGKITVETSPRSFHLGHYSEWEPVE